MTSTKTRNNNDSLLKLFVEAMSDPDRCYYDHYEMTTRDDYLKVFNDMKRQGYGALLVKERYQLQWSHPKEITQMLFDDVDEARDEMKYELGSMLENDSSINTCKMSVNSTDASITVNDEEEIDFTICSLTDDEYYED